MSEVKKKESFTHFAQVLAEGQSTENDDEVWYVSNASDHMTPKREWFTTFEEVPEGDWSVGELDGSQHWVRGRGNIKIQRKLGLQWEDGVLENVLYAPALRRNLFSLGRAVKQGNSASFGGTDCTLRNSEGAEMLTGTGHGGLFKLNVRVMPPELSC
ncbi:hypothetical protein KC19_7G008000 [Ceratodon purpureus]|uniref:Retrovirus-related Pol polyprotein from transposon TNT 1-94-like beta-barrel domain-containing protein n=1 Tax=Ceratodon purpureus TaxID=3225 RepID=A0A8T0H5N4_CERPU|nr:hypothetical protein KC19_7G008000 [Ceratodon purpureus]